MLDFSEEFQNGKAKVSKCWLDVTLVDGTVLEYTESRIMMGGIIRDSSTTVDGEFTVGGAVTGKLTVSLDNSDQELSPYDFRNATVVVWLGGLLTDSTLEKVNVGRYYVDEYTYNGMTVDLVAYDDMVKFDKNIDYTVSRTTSLETIVTRACNSAGLMLYGTLPSFASTYKVNQMPEQASTMTWHDVIAYIAQILCCYVHIVYVPDPGDYRVKFEWYNMSQMTSNQYDGGTFSTSTTPYSDGATLDGGTFDPWNTGDVADCGAFGDRSGVHVVSPPYDLVVDTDDVQITGVSVILDPTNNINATDETTTYTKTLGTDGYVIQISDNPFIETTTLAKSACTYLYSCLNGMRFRPLAASLVEDPSIEAGDVALIPDRLGNTYACFLSHVTYTVGGATQVSCDAASTMQNLKARYSGAQKTQALVQRIFGKSVSSAEAAMSGIMGALSNTMGLYDYSTISSSGTIYLFGNKNTLATSDIQWRFSAGSFSVSNDYGQHWVSAFSADGRAVLQEVYAVKVNADFIETGTLTVGGSDKGVGTIYIKDENDVTLGIIDDLGIYYGKLGITDNTNTGFFLSKDGLIIGDGDTDRYVKITPDGTTYIHDGSQAPGQEVIVVDPSFIVEGDDGTGTTRQSYITPSEIAIGQSQGNTYMSMSDGDLVLSGTISNSIGPVVATAGEDQISYIRLVDSGGTVSNVYMQVRSVSGFWGVTVWASDEKLKDDIRDSTVNALDALKKIKHRSFKWKRDGQQVDNGYVAQEIEQVIPGSTLTIPQDDGTVMKQIYEPGLIPYLSKAIQELSDKVDALEARVKELEGK